MNSKAVSLVSAVSLSVALAACGSAAGGSGPFSGTIAAQGGPAKSSQALRKPVTLAVRPLLTAAKNPRIQALVKNWTAEDVARVNIRITQVTEMGEYPVNDENGEVSLDVAREQLDQDIQIRNLFANSTYRFYVQAFNDAGQVISRPFMYELATWDDDDLGVIVFDIELQNVQFSGSGSAAVSFTDGGYSAAGPIRLTIATPVPTPIPTPIPSDPPAPTPSPSESPAGG